MEFSTPYTLWVTIFYIGKVVWKQLLINKQTQSITHAKENENGLLQTLIISALN